MTLMILKHKISIHNVFKLTQGQGHKFKGHKYDIY